MASFDSADLVGNYLARRYTCRPELEEVALLCKFGPRTSFAAPASDNVPHAMVRGEGIRVWNSARWSCIDASVGALSPLGHPQPRLVKAAAAQMAKLPFYPVGDHRSSDVVLGLAEDLAAMAPIPLGHKSFADSNAEAAASAINRRCSGVDGAPPRK